MRLIIAFFTLLAVAALAAGLVALEAGRLAVSWGGVEYETSLALGIFVLALIVAALIALAAGVAWLIDTPRRLTRRRAEDRLKRGYRAFARGMVAVAAGDSRQAERLAKEARGLLKDPPLTLLLGAQAAQLAGDERAAEESFTAMLADKDTEFLGLRGLFVQATRRGDRAVALAHLKRAAALRPGTAWVINALFDLHAADKRWAEAGEALEEARRARLIDDPVARRRRAVLLAAEAQALAGTQRARALTLAEEAVRLSPGLTPAAVLAARLLGEDDRAWRAQGIVENAWAQSPHPDLAEAYGALKPDEPPRARAQRLMGLAERLPDHEESRILTAQQLLVLRDFAQARSALGDLPERLPTARVAALMGEIAQGAGAAGEMRYWLDRAVRAPREPAWCCDSCQNQAPAWAPVCPHCGAFDTLAWRARAAVLALDGPASTSASAARALVPVPAPTTRGAATMSPPEPAAPPPASAGGTPLAQRLGALRGRGAPSEPRPLPEAPPAEAPRRVPAPAPRSAEPAIFVSPRPPDDPGPGNDILEEQGAAPKW